MDIILVKALGKLALKFSKEVMIRRKSWIAHGAGSLHRAQATALFTSKTNYKSMNIWAKSVI